MRLLRVAKEKREAKARVEEARKKAVAKVEAQNEDVLKAKAGERGARPAGSAKDTMKRIKQTSLLHLEEKQKGEGMRRESEEVQLLANPRSAGAQQLLKRFEIDRLESPPRKSQR